MRPRRRLYRFQKALDGLRRRGAHRAVVFLDHETNADIENPSSLLSHTILVKRYLEADWVGVVKSGAVRCSWSKRFDDMTDYDDVRNRTPPAPPPAEGVRLAWSDLPERLRQALEAFLGDTVAVVISQPGGFSPGLAARVVTASGRRAFVKAAGPAPNAFAPRLHRREAVIAAALPERAPVPRFLWSYDEGEGGWVALLFEDVDGRQPALPWRADELDQVLHALVDLWDSLTPSPFAAEPAGDWFKTNGRGWRRLQENPPAALDPWSVRRLAALAALEKQAEDAVAGETLIHFDLRADNLLLTAGRVVAVDWPHAHVGAPWVDLVAFAPSVTMQGGPDPEDMLRCCPVAAGANPAAVTAVIAAIAGFFTWHALQPAPPGLPTLRPFQAAQGAVARTWLARRTGWT